MVSILASLHKVCNGCLQKNLTALFRHTVDVVIYRKTCIATIVTL